MRKGNIYGAGSFEGTISLPPRAKADTLPSAGGSDSLLFSVKSSGNVVWTASLGGTGYDRASDITVDNSGNVYTTGFIASSAGFNPRTGSAFVVKFDGRSGKPAQ